MRRAFKYQWKLIRARHFAENSANCMLCHATAPIPKIDAHEIYSFPNAEVVKLERVLFVCKYCHDTIHLERTYVHCSHEYIRFIEQRYCEINSVSETELIMDYRATIQKSAEIRKLYGGSEAKPKVEFGRYQDMLDNALKRKSPRASCDEDEDDDPFPDHECQSYLIGRAFSMD